MTTAASEGRARRITIATGDDVDEFLFDQGVTDGLPVVPPTPVRVDAMLAATRRDPQEEIAVLPPNLAPLTVEKVAINAVLAGCKPEYFPVVLAGVEAVADPRYELHMTGATTIGAAPVLIINGPIRHRVGMNAGQGALGQGNRANATIGRAVRLVIRNVGGYRPGGTERATIGWPGKYTLCFAEAEERAPSWRPLHVEMGFQPEDSVITAIAQTGGPAQVRDDTSRTARALGGSIGLKILGLQHTRRPSLGEAIVVVSPEHYDTLAAESWTKDDLRRRIQEVSAQRLGDMVENEEMGGLPRSWLEKWPYPQFADPMAPVREGNSGPEAVAAAMDSLVPKFLVDEMIHIVVAGGGAGKLTGVMDPGGGAVSKKIEDA